MSSVLVSLDAKQDLVGIWEFIAKDNIEAADRVETEFYETFASLAKMPGMGHRRTDLTKRGVLFFPLYSYLIIYQPEANPVRIVAVVHGNRNVKRLLKERSF